MAVLWGGFDSPHESVCFVVRVIVPECGSYLFLCGHGDSGLFAKESF